MAAEGLELFLLTTVMIFVENMFFFSYLKNKDSFIENPTAYRSFFKGMFAMGIIALILFLFFAFVISTEHHYDYVDGERKAVYTNPVDRVASFTVLGLANIPQIIIGFKGLRRAKEKINSGFPNEMDKYLR